MPPSNVSEPYTIEPCAHLRAFHELEGVHFLGHPKRWKNYTDIKGDESEHYTSHQITNTFYVLITFLSLLKNSRFTSLRIGSGILSNISFPSDPFCNDSYTGIL